MNAQRQDWKNELNAYLALRRQSARPISRLDTARYFLPWLASCRNGRSAMGDERIWIVFKAERFLSRLLRPGLKVFEYGTGGSSLYFLKRRCELWSVEHHPGWYHSVAAEISKKQYVGWRGFLVEADPPSDAQNPIPGACSYRSEFAEYAGRTFQAYARTIDQFADGFFDLILIDGRARDSCFVHARRKLRIGGSLVLDNSERPRYQAIHEALHAAPWEKHEFFGPGPYVRHEFWATTFWRRLK